MKGMCILSDIFMESKIPSKLKDFTDLILEIPESDALTEHLTLTGLTLPTVPRAVTKDVLVG